MSNIFSTRKYTLPNGIEIDVPRGISIGTSKGRYFYAALRVKGKLKRIERLECYAEDVLLEAIDILIKSIKAGHPPGGYHRNKRTGTMFDELPPGLTIRLLESTGEYRLYISYPDVASEKLKHTNFYVGNEDTYLQNFDAVTKRGVIFRKKHMNAYRKEFLKRLNSLVEKVRQKSLVGNAA